MEDGAIITKIALRFQKIGPVLRHLFHPDDEYEDYLAKLKSKANKIYSVDQFELTYQIEEAIVEYGLKRKEGKENDENDSWQVKNWDFYLQPPSIDKIELSVIGIKTCKNIVKFDAVFTANNNNNEADALKSDTIYNSTKSNGWLFDRMTVDPENKIIFMYQVSSLLLDQHKLKYSTIDAVRSAFNVYNKGYQVRFVYCCDISICHKKVCVPSNDER
jgi:hypothetical protein